MSTIAERHSSKSPVSGEIILPDVDSGTTIWRTGWAVRDGVKQVTASSSSKLVTYAYSGNESA